MECVLLVGREVGMTHKQRDIKRKLAVLEYAQRSGDVARTCRQFGISGQS